MLTSDQPYWMFAGMSVLMLLVSLYFGILVLAVCGGGGSCGSCHVILPQDLYDKLPPMRDQEKELLASVVLGVTPTYHLFLSLYN